MRFLLFAIVCVTGCSENAGSAAERKYEMVERHGTPEERCAAVKDVANTYLQLGNEQKYEEWTLLARNECLAIEARRRLSS